MFFLINSSVRHVSTPFLSQVNFLRDKMKAVKIKFFEEFVLFEANIIWRSKIY